MPLALISALVSSIRRTGGRQSPIVTLVACSALMVLLVACTNPGNSPLSDVESGIADISSNLMTCDTDGDGGLDAEEYGGCEGKPAPFDSAGFADVDQDQDGFASVDNVHGYLTEDLQDPD